MYDLNYLYPIPADKSDEALSALTRHANHHTEAARILRAIKARSGCVGRTFNRACLPAMQAALPGYRVSYAISDYVKSKPRTLYVIRLDADGNPVHGPNTHWSFDLATKDRQQLTEAHIDERIAYHVEQTQQYSTFAAALPQQVLAYNAAAAYLKPIKDSISTAMLYAGI